MTLGVVEIGGTKGGQASGRKAAPPSEPKVGSAVAMDIAVEIQRATVRGEGLESDWRGTVNVTGSLDRPVINGPVDLQRGTFRILGKQLTLAPGSKVVFEGRSPPDPRLDIVALGRAEEVTAKVIVSGLASSPSLELASEPEVPKDEILARLLFGRKLGSLGAAQQLQIAQAAASLAFGGKGGGFDPVGKIRDFLGFDTLSVGGETGRMGGGQMVTSSGLASPTGAPNADSAGGGLAPSVSAGKYIDPDTFLQVGRGEEGPSVSVERRLGGGFSIESEVGARTGGGVSLRWTKDY
jgi:translocation and assembly module TamB